MVDLAVNMTFYLPILDVNCYYNQEDDIARHRRELGLDKGQDQYVPEPAAYRYRKFIVYTTI